MSISTLAKRVAFSFSAVATFSVVAVLIVAVLMAASPPSEHMQPKPSFTPDGQLVQPTGYREWVYVGTPLTPNELNPPEAPFPEFHNVYIHPADFAEFKKSGKFPDGTILIKELVSVGAKQASSGKGYFMGDFIGLEAAVKDSRRFPDEPGYWAYFSFGHKYPLAENTSAQPVATCNACHAANADEDWVFVRYYPVLRAAKP